MLNMKKGVRAEFDEILNYPRDDPLAGEYETIRTRNSSRSELLKQSNDFHRKAKVAANPQERQTYDKLASYCLALAYNTEPELHPLGRLSPSESWYNRKARELGDEIEEADARLHQLLGLEPHDKRKTAHAAVSAVFLVLGLFFLSPNITGNVIGNQTGPNIIGVVLIILGLIIGFFSVRKKS